MVHQGDFEEVSPALLCLEAKRDAPERRGQLHVMQDDAAESAETDLRAVVLVLVRSPAPVVPARHELLVEDGLGDLEMTGRVLGRWSHRNGGLLLLLLRRATSE